MNKKLNKSCPIKFISVKRKYQKQLRFFLNSYDKSQSKLLNFWSIFMCFLYICTSFSEYFIWYISDSIKVKYIKFRCLCVVFNTISCMQTLKKFRAIIHLRSYYHKTNIPWVQIVFIKHYVDYICKKTKDWLCQYIA